MASAPLRRKERPVPEEEVFDQLLGKGGSTAPAAALQVLVGSNLDLMPIEAVVLIEEPVLGGDDGVLKLGGDLAEGNELVARAIGLAVNPGLEAALDVDGGGGRIDPAGG